MSPCNSCGTAVWSNVHAINVNGVMSLNVRTWYSDQSFILLFPTHFTASIESESLRFFIKKMAMRKTDVLLVVNLLMDGWSG